jgi:PPOX class probable F420-dependent enzyme
MSDKELFSYARVAHLSTVGVDGSPHLVPMVFAVSGDLIHSAVDGKLKRHTALRRLANIAHEPRVAVLVDHYADDWEQLWWVRADGVARVREKSPDGLAALTAKYPQYVASPPPGPFLEIEVSRWNSWAARPGYL